MGDLYFCGVCGKSLGKGGDKGGGFLAAIDVVDDVTIVGAQHAAVIAHVHTGHLVGGDVDDTRGGAAEQGVLPFPADRPDHVVPLFHLGDQHGNLFGGVLQVGVEGDDDLSAALLEGGKNRHVLAEIAVELDHPHFRESSCHALEDAERAVAAAIVGENDLEAFADPLHDRIEAVDERREVQFLVEDRDDYGYVRFFRHWYVSCRGAACCAPAGHFRFLTITFFTASTTSLASSMVIFGKSGRERMRSEA